MCRARSRSISDSTSGRRSGSNSRLIPSSTSNSRASSWTSPLKPWNCLATERPCLSAFRLARARPTGLRGPVLFCALRRLASCCRVDPILCDLRELCVLDLMNGITPGKLTIPLKLLHGRISLRLSPGAQANDQLQRRTVLLEGLQECRSLRIAICFRQGGPALSPRGCACLSHRIIWCGARQQVSLNSPEPLDPPCVIDDGLGQGGFNGVARTDVSGQGLLECQIGLWILGANEHEARVSSNGLRSRLCPYAAPRHRRDALAMPSAIIAAWRVQ